MYRPLPEEVTIKKSEIEGLGLFTTKDVKKSHVFGTSHILDYRFENNYIRTPLGGFVRNSSKPNCMLLKMSSVKGGFSLSARRDISEGEELTTKYSLYEFEETNGKD
tara:strand:- start:1269 stop:1589 length:321 start_codon:yes stop_codon:yes gene_type:complete